MRALMFPGQGSQSIGMGLDLFKKFDYVKELFFFADMLALHTLWCGLVQRPRTHLLHCYVALHIVRGADISTDMSALHACSYSMGQQ